MADYNITSLDVLSTNEFHTLRVEALDENEAIEKALDLLRMAGLTGVKLLTVTRIEFITTTIKEVK